MYTTRYNNDDIVPMLRDSGVAATLAPWLRKNASEEFLIELIQIEHSIVLLTRQIRQLLADLKAVGDMPSIDVAELPNPIARAAPPSGIGINVENVWVSIPEGSYTLRFYVNSELKLTMPDYYITSLASIGAVSGDVVQVCQVVDGIPGWWARITIP